MVANRLRIADFVMTTKKRGARPMPLPLAIKHSLRTVTPLEMTPVDGATTAE